MLIKKQLQKFHISNKLCLGLALLALMAPYPVRAEAKRAGLPPAPVVIAEAEHRELAPVAWFAGSVISRNDAKLAAEVKARVVWVADVGTTIEKDQAVARLDDLFIKQQLIEHEATILREEARLVFFSKEVKRLKRLAKHNIAAQRQLDQSVMDRAMAQSELNVARARIIQAREQLQRTQLNAPFTGVVTERFKRAGEWAESGDEVVRLVDPLHVEIQTRVPVTSLPHISLGALLNIKTGLNLKAGDKQRQATVESIVPVGDDRSRLYEIRLLPSLNDWRAGQTVRVAVPTAKARVVVAVPRDALVLRQEGARVFRIKADNTAEPIKVSIGIASGDLIEVQGNIQAGDRVVIRGGERLRPGQKVIIKNGKHP